MLSDQYNIRLATAADKQKIMVLLLNDFYHTEPTNSAVALSVEGAEILYKHLISECLIDEVSLVCECLKTGSIAGVRLSKIIQIKDGKVVKTESDLDLSDRGVITITNYLDALKTDFEKLLPVKCGKILEMIILNVAQQHCHQGIATALIDTTEQLAKKTGCLGMLASSTALASQELFLRKLNFSLLRTLEHRDYVGDDGSQLIVCRDGTTSGMLLFKMLV